MAEPGVDFDLDHLHRTRHAGADREVGEAAHHPAEDHAHEAGVLQRRAHARAAICLLSSGRTPETLRSGEAASISRHGALEPGTGLRFALCSIAALSFCIASSVGGTTEAVVRLPPDPGPSGKLRIADADLDLVRFESEFMRHRIGDHGAAAGADILNRGAGDEASALDRQFDLRAGLPEIEPVPGRHANTAAIAAGLRRRRLPVAPDLQPGGPIVKTLAVGVGIPALAQRDRIDLHPECGFVDRLLQRKGHRRPAGTAEGGTGRQVADDVEIGQLLCLRRIDQSRERCDGRVHRGASVGIGGERQRFEIAGFGRQQRDLHLGRRAVTGDGKFFMPVESDPHRRLGLARELNRRHGLHAKAGLRAEAAADMVRHHSDLVMVELVAFGDQLHQVEYRLRRDMHGKAVAIEAGDGCVRLEAGVLLRAGTECPLDQQRILRLARAIHPAPGLLCLVGERRGRATDVPLPGRR